MDPERTVFVGNIPDIVTKDVLEEIFVQMGPLYNINLVERPPSNFAFVEFVDDCSVLYACEMLQELKLHGNKVSVRPKDKTQKYYEWERKKNENRDNRQSYDNRPRKRYSRRSPNNHNDGWGNVEYDNYSSSSRRSPPAQYGGWDSYYITPPPPPFALPPVRYQPKHYGSADRINMYMGDSWRNSNDNRGSRNKSGQQYQKVYKKNFFK